MRSMKTFGVIAIFLVFYFCLPMAAYAKAQERFEHSYEMDMDGTVYLQNVSGHIEVSSWDRKEVRIEAVKEAHNENALGNMIIDIVQTDGTVRIKTRHQRAIKWFWSYASVHYKLTVPDRAHVRTETVSGDTEVKYIGGTLEVKSVSGNINIQTAMDGVQAHTVSGDIVMSDIAGNVDIKTTSGEVEIEGSKGSVEAESVSGDIELTNFSDTQQIEMETISGNISIKNGAGSPAGFILDSQTVSGNINLTGFSDAQEIKMETLSGDILIKGRLRPTGEYALGSHSGEIRVVLPSNSNFDFSAKAMSGDIDIDFDLKLSGRIDRKKINGTVGQGGARLKISNFSGDILVKNGDH